MKRRFLVCLLIFALLTAGCSVQKPLSEETASPGLPTAASSELAVPDTADTEENIRLTTEIRDTASTEPVETAPMETEPAVTEPAAAFLENAAFTEIAGPDCDASILAVLYNAPFVDGDPIPTEIWCEGEYDRLVICPRWVGSEITAWQILRVQDEEGEFEYLDGPIYSTVCAEGTCIGAALDRPEGGAAWALSVTAPDGASANLELYYNGRYGTFAYEYLTDNSAVLSEEELSLEPEIVHEMERISGEEAFCSLLRAAARTGRDPWAVIERYCSPLDDIGDAAAYTVCQGDMEGDVYRMEAARLHENYDPQDGSIAERTAYQAALYAEIGNDMGILGPEKEGGETLYFDLNGLTVYNPTLLAQEVTITVNGIEIGTFDLTVGDYVTLLDVCVGEIPAETPIEIALQVTETRGDPNAAILEVWPGLGGNISGAR